MEYIEKLENHKRFELSDIQEFIQEQVKVLDLKEFVNNIEEESVFCGIASYGMDDKTISVSNNFKADFKYYKKKCFESNLLQIISCNNNDLYNLYIINTVFHEIWHARQNKELNENRNSSYSHLNDISFKIMLLSGSTYHKYHDRYFIEFDAIINSIKLTLNFVERFNFQENALLVLNKLFAKEILNCYKKTDYIENEEYGSPILTLEFLIKYLSFTNKFPGLEVNMIIEMYKNEYGSDDDLSNLMNGIQISERMLEVLSNIKKGDIRTTNILQALSSEKKENKHI